ncbi:MAG: hypothetical protein HGA22_14230, partial [Clostridiales bacterium]|nr:hypothetical protein [Clostridiales bacterium]
MKTNKGQLKIGAGRSVIDIPALFFPCENFGGIHDNLHARAILLDNGINRVIFAVIEMTSLGNDFAEDMRYLVSRECEVDAGNVHICASHTFQAPHLRPAHLLTDETEAMKNELLKDAVIRALTAAVRQAREGIRPGRMGFGTGRCNVN